MDTRYLELLQKNGCELDQEDLNQIDEAERLLNLEDNIDLFLELIVVAYSNQENGMEILAAKIRKMLTTIDSFTKDLNCGDRSVAQLSEFLWKFNQKSLRRRSYCGPIIARALEI